MKKITIYTDGACKSNPGPGGWCAILLYKNTEKIIKGNEADTTNNRMELMAVIEGLKSLKEPCMVELNTDSNYIYKAFTAGWLDNWKKNGWQRKEKKKLLELKNSDLWQQLDEQADIHKINWKKVPAHSGIPLNEKCDKIASDEAKSVERRDKT
ncbi:MAG: ribonuclease HI [Calditrichia bacterium]|nr:ribonuclease HI [Calditrichia bacterium]